MNVNIKRQQRSSSKRSATLRWTADLEKTENHNSSNHQSVLCQEQQPSTVNRTPTKSALRNHSDTTRYCPSGHVLVNNIPVAQRQKYLQELQTKDSNDSDTTLLPVVGCDACSQDILAGEIGATCAVCDLDFCQRCYNGSGKSVEELLNEAREAILQQHFACSSASISSSVEGSLRSFNSTQEFCAEGHELIEISTLVRQRYIQDRDGLDVLPIIECDCCSKEIRDETIAGSDVVCDIDICKDCFKNGQSYDDVLEDRRQSAGEQPHVTDYLPTKKGGQQRYNERRPTYKSTGRVSYDNYPDPTAFQWKFTGSSKSRPVEYFEKDFGPEVGVVLLDMYYARGTVKTTLVHPTKGERILFSNNAESISSNSYRKILKDPRSYTNRRYKPAAAAGKASRQVV
jgi:hypothetical protein